MKSLKGKIFTYFKEKIDKRTCILFMLASIALIFSLIMYGKDKEGTFEKATMQNIFLEDSDYENEESTDENYNDTNTQINENLIQKEQIVVEIKGEVNKPDVYYLEEGSIIKNLIDSAGGTTENAYLDNINRAQKLRNNDCIVISNKNDENADIKINNTVNTNNSLGDSTMTDGKININTATIDQLKTLKGIGDAKAQDIIEYRESNNGFKSVDELKNVKGIGEKTFESIKDSIST